eukprot:TRINITY_DN6148_c0_g1_i1.p1 TRINITY_DN6148_c0_g1~~TRINITY_DN6148_c0_g1_i1.p1  ORF type:complete len:269 (+),score=34.23 TRINITY_DN6148_c0_g1_i1:96-902(+)
MQILSLLVLSLLGFCSAGHRAMPWMCLERCSENIQVDLEQLEANSDTLSAVSFEAYDLGKDGGLIDNNFTSVNDQILSLGLQTFPMVTTVNLESLRTLFSDPQPFIEAAVKQAVMNNYTGFCLDFEPTDRATEQDAQDYAKFLSTFAQQLHGQSEPKTLSVCVAHWNTFWNFTAIGLSEVDYVLDMDTYASAFSDFQNLLQEAVASVPLQKLGIGIITSHSDGTNFTTQEMQERFDLINHYNIQEVDIWMTPIPDNFWSFLEAFRGKS